MGSFLDKPKTEKTTDHGQGNDLRYGLSAMQGWRIEMEDSHCSIIGLPKSGFEQWSFFAVFDGHAGGTVSKFSSKELLNSILNADPELFDELASIYSITSNQKQSSPTSTATSSNNNTTNINNSVNTSTDTNLNNNNELTINKNDTLLNNTDNSNSNVNSTNNNTNINKNNSNTETNTEESINNNNTANCTNNTVTPSNKSYTQSHEDRLKNAIRQGFLNLDEKIRRLPEFDRGEDKSGSTAVACLISPTHVYLINCGDSRAILVSNNQVVLGTYDHKPVNPIERERIHNAGGSVMIQRVNGSLAVSRALGDYEYKNVDGRGPCEQLVSPEPEIYVKERSQEKDEFVILACDGIWDVMANDDLKDFVTSRLKITNDLVKISNDVLDTCLSKGSRDNMSVIIVSFPSAPKVVQDEVDKDNTCNEKIENRIKELIENSTNSRLEFSQLLHTISEEHWEDLPPGGGLHAKHALIEEIYNKFSPKNNEDDSISTID